MKRLLALAALVAVTFSLAACDGISAQSERQAAVDNQAALLLDTPIPILDHSEERQNLIDRAKLLNQRSMTGCITLLDHGTIVATIPTDGKVSSLNSYLLSGDKPYGNGSAGYTALEQADIDGAYGENVPGGIFFFTAETRSYVEWKGTYLFSDQCLDIVGGREPLLVQPVAAE